MKRVVAILAFLVGAAALGAQAPRPPEQPKSGPGGSECAHREMVRKSYGAGNAQYWIFEPAEPTPRSAPVVVFLHGWLAMDPAIYMGWIRHIVRRGAIVIYPRYQESAGTAPWTFARNAVDATKQALERLKTPGHVAPDLAKFAIVGHSAGAALTADLAALAADNGLPPPKALMVVEPGRGPGGRRNPFFAPADYAKIPADALLLVVVGDQDRVVGDACAKDIYQGMKQIPADHKSFIVVQTDRHGSPPLVADHLSPCAPERAHWFVLGQMIDALDYCGYWRLFDALTDCAFYGKNREYCLGNTPPQRFMGCWSDGTPVKELLVKEAP